MSASDMDVDSAENLDNVRKEIDKIDDKILELLGERSKFVEVVGKIKNTRNTKNSIIRPGREAAMIRRIASKQIGAFPKAAIAHLWRLIIASSITIEENTRVSALSPQHNTECYWLAREYFGAFTPINKHASTMNVIDDVVNGNATVGVVPVWDDNSPKTWWVRFTELPESPRVFARLPFIKMAPSQKSPLIAFGYINPEPTGDDRSLWVLKISEDVALEQVEVLMKQKIGANIKILDHYRQMDEAAMRCYLVKVGDFVDSEDKRMEKVLKEIKEKLAKDSAVNLYYLGAYAVPMTING